jgi:pimeloyl-ACP methyl ester carboxylesterase
MDPGPLAGAVVWADEVTDETGPGSLYSMNVPVGWNGKLVVFVHGFVDAALPVALPSIAPLRDALGAAGYAVAFSSFSENGFNYQDGLQRTHQLRGLFAARFGNPTRTFLIGSSLGSLISVGIAERFPGQYDGAVLTCGIVGGSRMTFQYLGDVRALFDFFYPGVLPGNVVGVPPITDLAGQILGPAQAAILGNPGGAVIMASIDQTPLPGNSVSEKITSLITALAFHARGVNDAKDRSQGHAPYGNDHVTYTSTAFGGVMPAVNAGIGRFQITADASQWLDHNYEPTGMLQIPVITLHVDRDPVAPLFHRDDYGSTVGNAGAMANLLQRTISAYGHCALGGSDIISALNDLTGWVETGIKPAQ